MTLSDPRHRTRPVTDLAPPSVNRTAPPDQIDPAVHRRRWRILGVLALSLIIVSLDNTVLNVALPSIQRDLNASAEDLQWIVDAYTLVFAGLVLLGGNIGDRYGRKGCLQIGLAILAAGSTLAVLSDTTLSLTAARAIMGVGGAFVMPATLSITTSVFVGAERGKAIGAWSACAGIGVAIGPIAGGWLVEHFWWGSVFLINVPIVLIALISGAFLLPSSRNRAAGPPDLAGAALSTSGLIALVYAIIDAPDDGWTSIPVLGSFLAAAVLLGSFIAVELRSPNPMLPLRFFRSARFSAASLSISIIFFALIGSLFFLTQYLQITRGYTALEAGVRTIPVALGLGLTSACGPALAARHGAGRVIAGGMTVTGLGLAMVGFIHPGTNYAHLMLALAVMGLGMGATMAPATASIMSTIPAAQAGVGSAVNDSVRQLSSALGVAILGSVLKAHYSSDLASQLSPIRGLTDAPRKLLLDSVAGAHRLGASQLPDPRIPTMADAAFISAMNATALLAAALAIVGAFVVTICLPYRIIARGRHRAAASGRHRRVSAG